MSELSARARQVLYHCVTEYVSTGEPVGSRTLAKKSGLDLSPASIRNVLADLEDAGYLRQPHTSAGRVPTDRAFRLFIDVLMQVRDLTSDDEASIRDRFASLEYSVPHANVMRETGRLLSELTGTAAVVVAPRAEMLVLKQLRFLRTAPEEVLAVLVMKNGTVQNRFLRVTVTDDDLQRIHNLLDDVVEGRTLGDLRELFERRLQSERVQHDELRRRAFELGGAAVEQAAGRETDLVIEGQEKLLEKPEFDDADHVRRLVTALDARKKLVRLLDLAMKDPGGQVVVGEEAGDLGGGLAIVGAPYTAYGQAAGTVGVIGPTRMDYARVLPLVAATASAMSEFMDRSEGGGKDVGSTRSDHGGPRGADVPSTAPRRSQHQDGPAAATPPRGPHRDSDEE
ncbi:MAG TPA: heat-inducible transcriptional repressor HrcA [Polyangiaceae bacterium]|nr:heat-inducible transcriptional repressor HrcA [Polyangiaceae bacterium]